MKVAKPSSESETDFIVPISQSTFVQSNVQSMTGSENNDIKTKDQEQRADKVPRVFPIDNTTLHFMQLVKDWGKTSTILAPIRSSW